MTAENIRAAIVEDEPAAARLLAAMLGKYPDLEIVGRFDSGNKAVEALAADPVDALFLDVQIPDFDGFEMLRQLPNGNLPAIVFVTAYDRYALRAFEIAAVDYLLKPFDEKRLDEAVTRLRSRLNDRDPGRERAGVIAALGGLNGLRADRRFRRHLAVWIGPEQRALLVPVEQIAWIEANGKRLCAHTATGVFPLPGPLRDLQGELDPESFIRINRSTLVNVAFVREIQKSFRGDYLFLMKDGKRLRSSAFGRPAVLRLLGRN
jgi:two-component system, LytTR family, response regulator